MSEEEKFITQEKWVRLSKIKEEKKCIYRVNWELVNTFYCDKCWFSDTMDVCISRLITLLNNNDFKNNNRGLLS